MTNRPPTHCRHTLALLLLVAACSGRASARDDTPAAERQDTLPAFTTAPVRRAARSSSPARLRAVWAQPDSAVDRLVFEFSGDTLPGYEAEFTPDPMRRCGSGDLVSLAGTSHLLLRFSPAQAHDDSGRITLRNRDWTPGLPVLRDVTLVCDFEGHVEWAIGLEGLRPYRILEAAGAARVTFEVRHP